MQGKGGAAHADSAITSAATSAAATKRYTRCISTDSERGCERGKKQQSSAAPHSERAMVRLGAISRSFARCVLIGRPNRLPCRFHVPERARVLSRDRNAKMGFLAYGNVPSTSIFQTINQSTKRERDRDCERAPGTTRWVTRGDRRSLVGCCS